MPLVKEADLPALHEWVLPKLDTISDADPEVLADFVVALFRDAKSEEDAKQGCVVQLADFLHGDTARFMDELMDAVKTESFLPQSNQPALSQPSAQTPAPSTTLSAEARPFNPPSGPSIAPPFNPPSGPSNAPPIKAPTGPSNAKRQKQKTLGAAESLAGDGKFQSRKRTYNEHAPDQDGQDAHYIRGASGDRPNKQVARTGGRNSRGDFNGQNRILNKSPVAGMTPAAFPVPHLPFPVPPVPFPPSPLPFPGFQGLDPANPMGPLLAFAAAAMSMGFPGMPSMQPPVPPPLIGSGLPGTQVQKVRARCNDYDTKGYCVLGSLCPYEHGGETTMADDANVHDSDQTSLLLDPTATITNGKRKSARHEKARTKVTGGRKQASFSLAGPDYNRLNTTVVVEQIPEEKAKEEDVRNFFSQFGKIAEVHAQPYKRRAIVKYEDRSAAERAFDSPKVIFDNRFVRVDWLTSGANAVAKTKASILKYGYAEEGDVEMTPPEERRAEAQKAFEERQKKAKEAERKLMEIEQQLKTKEDDIRNLRAKIAEKTSNLKLDGPGLATQLVSLQEEAEDLESAAEAMSYQGRGRGGYRGQVYYPPRGRGYTPFRGAPRGRGFVGNAFGGARCGVKRLDNRPRKVGVEGVEAGTPQDEAMRQHLLNSYEYESIETHPEKADTQIVTFKERYVAEMFHNEARNIPNIGKVAVSWVASNTLNTSSPTPNADTVPVATTPGGPSSDEPTPGAQATDGKQAEAPTTGRNGEVKRKHGNADADHDVADDESQW